MIQILPTASSGLPASNYSLKLRVRGDLPNLHKERPQRLAITLSGETIVSSWQKFVSGTVFTIDSVISQSEYETLRRIDENSSVFEWVIILSGRTFTASIDLQSAAKNNNNYSVRIQFTIISEQHR